MKHLLATILLLSLVGRSHCLPVDNAVIDDPEITCGDTAIGIKFATKNPFNGRLFVKGEFGRPECRALPNANGSGLVSSTGMDIEFMDCGVTRTRSADPRGVFLGVTVIISFHPQFISKVDKAYMIQCYYMEAMTTCETEIQVSMLTTSFQTAIIPMPVCRYEVLQNDANGSPVRYVTIGQQVYHKWTCETDTVDVFCMSVHSCKVDDGAGDVKPLLDAQGCAVDKHLLNNLEYPMDLMAGQEAHVFKYADRANLFFDCQISISVKEPGTPCLRQQCPVPQRGKRSEMQEMLPARTNDVQSLLLSEPQPGFRIDGLELDMDLLNQRYFHEYNEQGSVCMEMIYFILYLVGNLMTVMASVSLFCASCKKMRCNVGNDF